jgi:hypothetical protein
MSAVRTERTAHLVPPGRVSARQREWEPVSGFEPLTVRLLLKMPRHGMMLWRAARKKYSINTFDNCAIGAE